MDLSVCEKVVDEWVAAFGAALDHRDNYQGLDLELDASLRVPTEVLQTGDDNASERRCSMCADTGF
jgi:hypothetical protein